MGGFVSFNKDFNNRFEILREAKILTKNEFKELSYRERKVLKLVLDQFKKPNENKRTKYEIKLKKHLDDLIKHKPVHRSKAEKVFLEVKNKLLQLTTGDLYEKLHHSELIVSTVKPYREKSDIDLVISFASDILGKPQDHLLPTKIADQRAFTILDYDSKKPLLSVKICSPEIASIETGSPHFLKAGKLARSEDILIATSQIYS